MGAGGLLGAVAAPWVQRRLSPAVVIIGANWVWAAFVPLFAVARWGRSSRASCCSGSAA
jgi:hypothetical protein